LRRELGPSAPALIETGAVRPVHTPRIVRKDLAPVILGKPERIDILPLSSAGYAEAMRNFDAVTAAMAWLADSGIIQRLCYVPWTYTTAKVAA